MFCFPAMKWDIHGKDEMGKGLSNGGKWWKGVFVISVRQKVSQIIFERAPNGDGAPFWCFFFADVFHDFKAQISKGVVVSFPRSIPTPGPM